MDDKYSLGECDADSNVIVARLVTDDQGSAFGC